VEYPEELARWVTESRPGTPVRLVWVRDEVRHEGQTSLGQSPDLIPEWALPPA